MDWYVWWIVRCKTWCQRKRWRNRTTQNRKQQDPRLEGLGCWSWTNSGYPIKGGWDTQRTNFALQGWEENVSFLVWIWTIPGRDCHIDWYGWWLWITELKCSISDVSESAAVELSGLTQYQYFIAKYQAAGQITEWKFQTDSKRSKYQSIVTL